MIALAWIALISPPCVMGLTLDPAVAAQTAAEPHDCPHCPPGTAVDVARDDCSSGDYLTTPRPDKSPELPVLALADASGIAVPVPRAAAARARLLRPAPPPIPGPRIHLRHGQFNE